MNCQAVLMYQYFLMFDKFVSHFFRFFIILIQDFFEFVLSSKECQYLKHLRNNNLISLITFYWLDKSLCFNAKYATIINEFTLSIQGNFMHLTVTPWRSLFPMAQKSEVSDIAAPVPLETGKKKVLCACRHTFHYPAFLFCTICYAPTTQFPKVHTTYEHKENLKKSNSNCNKSIVLKVPSVAFVEFSWKQKESFFLAYNFCSPRAWRQ